MAWTDGYDDEFAEFPEHYDALGLRSTCSQGDVRKAFHKLAMLYHPDKIAPTDTSRRFAEARFKEISEAYEVLGDERRRREYDTLRAARRAADPEAGSPGATPLWGADGTTRRRSPSAAPRQPGERRRAGRSPGAGRRGMGVTERWTVLFVAALFAVLLGASGVWDTPRRVSSQLLGWAWKPAQYAPLGSRQGAVRIHGFCAAQDGFSGEYIPAGNAAGRVWYHKRPGYQLYYDPRCDGDPASPSGWFLNDIDDDGGAQLHPPPLGAGCSTSARIRWEGRQLPMGMHHWEVACGTSSGTSVIPLTVSEARGAHTEWRKA